MKVTLYSRRSQVTAVTPSSKVQGRCHSESKFKNPPHNVGLSNTDSRVIFLRDGMISDKGNIMAGV